MAKVHLIMHITEYTKILNNHVKYMQKNSPNLEILAPIDSYFSFVMPRNPPWLSQKI